MICVHVCMFVYVCVSEVRPCLRGMVSVIYSMFADLIQIDLLFSEFLSVYFIQTACGFTNCTFIYIRFLVCLYVYCFAYTFI